MKFNFRLPLYTGVGCLIAVIALELFAAYDVGQILFILVAPLVILALLVNALVRRSLSVFAMFCVCCPVSFFFWKFTYEIRVATRWLAWSGRYESAVLAQPESPHGALKHIQWDCWGWVPIGDIDAYVVFDPADSLAGAVNDHSLLTVGGIPCQVVRVDRLERDWYSVVLPTDMLWPFGRNACSTRP